MANRNVIVVRGTMIDRGEFTFCKLKCQSKM